MSTLTSLTPQTLGWFGVFCFTLYQLYAPKLGVTTRVKEITDNFNARIDRIGERITEVEERQEKHVTITEIIAVEQNDIDGAEVKTLFNDEDLHREDILEDE
jgi:hypothetical protein